MVLMPHFAHTLCPTHTPGAGSVGAGQGGRGRASSDGGDLSPVGGSMVTVLTQRRRPTGEELAACPQITLSAEVAGLLHDVRSAPTSTPHPHRVIIPSSFPPFFSPSAHVCGVFIRHHHPAFALRKDATFPAPARFT
jgi:hypothetical protein